MAKKKKVSAFYSKYCFKGTTETWDDYIHRVQLEIEIQTFILRSKFVNSLDITNDYKLEYQTDIQKEALRKLADMVLFQRSCTAYHDNQFSSFTRQSLVNCISDRGLCIDWCICARSMTSVLISHTAAAIFWVSLKKKDSASMSLSDIFLKQKLIKEDLLTRCRCKLLWYLLNYRSTPVVLPGDKGVLRNIIGFIL
jgi:hypothetical protein